MKQLVDDGAPDGLMLAQAGVVKENGRYLQVAEAAARAQAAGEAAAEAALPRRRRRRIDEEPGSLFDPRGA